MTTSPYPKTPPKARRFDLERFFRRFGGIELAGEPEVKQGLIFCGLKSLLCACQGLDHVQSTAAASIAFKERPMPWETVPQNAAPQSAALPRLRSIHHAAFRCRDAEQTRWFYEEILDLPLAAALVIEEEPGVGRVRPYMHLFFELNDGNYLAFFDDPSAARAGHFEKAHGFDRHVALRVESEEELMSWHELINAKGVTCLGPVDHGFVKSIYMYDPNGLQVEITVPTLDYQAIMAAERAHAYETISAWTAQTRDHKEALFGAHMLDKRGRFNPD